MQRAQPTTVERRRSRRTPAPAGLSPELIATTALELSDRAGEAGISMRRVAEELGVTPMALYAHFRDKDELLDAVIDLAASELTLPSERGPWKRQLRLLMDEIRRGVERHPGALRTRLARPLMTPGALRTSERGMRILKGAGFRTRDAASAWRALFSYTLGFATYSSEGAAADARRHARGALASLPEAEFPALTSAVDESTDAMGGDAQFEFGLRALIDGLERRALRAPPSRKG